jgi:hypothetical protein
VVVTDYEVNVVEGTAAPTWTVGTGQLPEKVGDRVTITIDLDPTWPFDTKELVVTTWQRETTAYAESWVYELSSEERTAGAAEVDVMLTSEPPTEEFCAISYTGRGTCYGPMDDGLTTTGWHASTGTGGEASTGAPIPISVDPLVEETGTDDCRSYDECCGCTPDPDLGTNICPLQCTLYSYCSCPAGASDLGEDATGYRTCECPA